MEIHKGDNIDPTYISFNLPLLFADKLELLVGKLITEVWTEIS